MGFVPGEGLASSVMGLDHMVRHMKKSTSATLPEAVRMASIHPAEFLGLGATHGRIDPGCNADLVLMDDDYRVLQSWIGGVATRQHP